MRAFVDSLLSDPSFAQQIVHRREVPAEEARWAEPARPLSPAIRAAALRLGVSRLFIHQAEAIDGIRAGWDVAVVTPTASGKSLVHYLPTAEMLEDGGHALYLYPHKALEQDQLKKLEVFGRDLYGGRSLTAEIYDGDTPQARRRKIRSDPPDVLITNPDMLHLGLLAHHADWARVFGSLRLVVVDELHVYRGIFGSHFAHVMRRLARVTARYGAEPRYLVSSATIGNAASFARSLLGRPFHVVTESGSPRAARHFLFVNPTGSPYTAATRIFVECVRAGLRTIAFTKARKITELIHSWVVQQADPDLARRIAPYRAGYLPEERREIERRLFRGDLAGVVATSALELGIDVGGLDACVLVGYPGSVMSAWQRIGRVGRETRESLVVLVAQPDALDQYFMLHPDEFFTRSFEPAVVDPSNPLIAGAHLVCASAELPASRAEADSYLGRDDVTALVARGRLVEDEAGERLYCLKRNPQRDVNLRSGGESYAILADEGSRPIGRIDGVRVFHECHEGAIYLHGGASYRVVRLDRDAKRVMAVPFRGDYYTQALGRKQTEILETLREQARNGYRLSLGRLKVTVLIEEYARKRLRDQETISKHPLDLPPIVFETVGFWMTLPDGLALEAVRRELHFMGGLHAGEHAMISLFPLLALCDRSDVGGISYSLNPQLGAPAIFIYDGYPGGIGLAASVHDRIEDLFRATRALLDRCPCDEGCPSCVQSPKCGSGNRPLDKQAARMLLTHLTGETLTDGDAPHPSVRPAILVRAASGVSMEVRVLPAVTSPSPAPPAPAPFPPETAAAAPAKTLPTPMPHTLRPSAMAMDVRLRSAADSPASSPRPPAPPSSEAAAARVDASPAATSEGPTPITPIPPAAASAGVGAALSAEQPALPFPARAVLTFSARPEEGRVLFFDVETRRSAEDVGGWNRIRDMGLALAVVLDVTKNRYTTYFESDVERLVLDLVMADQVIGYNTERFDLVVLSAYGSWDMSRIRSFDMLKYIRNRFGLRLRLGDLASSNLGAGKSADGLQSLAWFKEGRLDLIEAYCRQDVEVTARLFFLGRERGYLLHKSLEGAPLKLPVDW